MSIGEQTTTIGDVMENESHEDGILMGWNPLAGEVVTLACWRRGDQLACSHILVR